MHIRTAEPADLSALVELYKEVSRQGNGLASAESEVTDEYVSNFLTKSINSGLSLVTVHPDDPARLVGEIHAYRLPFDVFRHVLTGLTIAVHPSFQGRKIGRTMFGIFLEEIAMNRPDVGRVELITRESNVRAIRFYQSLGFRIEGRLEMRIHSADGTYEADIPMGWQNPNFEF